MAELRILYRAARELYLGCQRERIEAEAVFEIEAVVEPDRLGRVVRGLARETAMRQASLRLVRRLNSPA